MVAYNFQSRFAGPIKRGEKSHTIRKNGKRRHARPGEPLQLYTGMRTKSCKKIVAKDPVCVFCKTIRIYIGESTIYGIPKRSRLLMALKALQTCTSFGLTFMAKALSKVQ